MQRWEESPIKAKANMFCKECGNKIIDGSLFCNKCGTKVGENNNPPVEKVFLNRCESCGANLKRLSANHYLCEYCGSEYYTNNENIIMSHKITEKEIMDVFYKAAELEKKNKFWDELQCLLSIVDKASDNVLFLVKLGRAYRRNNMLQKALECYEKARILNSEFASIYSNIGAVYILTKQYELAQASCQRAVELMNRNRAEYTNDDYAVAHSNLAIAVGMQGQKENAKKYLKIAEQNGYQNGAAVRKMVGIKKGLFSFG